MMSTGRVCRRSGVPRFRGAGDLGSDAEIDQSAEAFVLNLPQQAGRDDHILPRRRCCLIFSTIAIMAASAVRSTVWASVETRMEVDGIPIMPSNCAGNPHPGNGRAIALIRWLASLATSGSICSSACDARGERGRPTRHRCDGLGVIKLVPGPARAPVRGRIGMISSCIANSMIPAPWRTSSARAVRRIDRRRSGCPCPPNRRRFRPA